jgi:hypothetical protein
VIALAWKPRSSIATTIVAGEEIRSITQFDQRAGCWRWRVDAPGRTFDFGERGLCATAAEARSAARAAVARLAGVLEAEAREEGAWTATRCQPTRTATGTTTVATKNDNPEPA